MRIAQYWAAVLLLAGWGVRVVGTASAAEASPSDGTDEVSFVLLSHVYPLLFDGTQEDIERLLRSIRALEPDALVLSGDIVPGTWDISHWRPGSFASEEEVRAAVSEQWDRVFELLKPLGVPIWIAPGNHDISSYQPEHIESVRKVFREVFGAARQVRYLEGVRLIFLDSCKGPAGTPYGIAEDQKNWLAQELEKQTVKTLIFVHHPLWFSGSRTTPGNTQLEYPWMEEIHPLIRGKVQAVFAGDAGDHGNYLYYDRRDGIYYYLSGSGRKGVSFLHVTIRGTEITVLPQFLDLSARGSCKARTEEASAWRIFGYRSFWLGVLAGGGLMLAIQIACVRYRRRKRSK